MESNPQRYRQQLESTPWFRGISLEFQDHLLNNAMLLRLNKGEALYRCGDPSCGLYALLDGAIAIGTVGVDGKEALAAVLGPTAWIGEISLVDGLARPHDATAASRALLLHVPETALRSLLDATPLYWRDIALLMAQRLRVSFKTAEALSVLSAAQRVASRLLLIAEGYGGLNETQSTIKLSQDSLASMVSLSRQTTNQMLKELERKGIVSLKFGQLTILDMDRLREAAVESSPYA